MVRFQCCGNAEAPGWLLANVPEVAKVSSVRSKLIAQDITRHILGDTLRFEQIKALTKVHSLSLSEIKAYVAVLDFVLTGAAKYSVDAPTFQAELLQLGFPQETAAATARVYESNQDALRKRQVDQTVQLPRLESLEWRVDCVVASNSLDDVTIPTVHLKFKTSHTIGGAGERSAPSDGASGAGGAGAGSSAATGGAAAESGREETVEMSVDKFRVLFNELKKARALLAAAE